MLETISVISGSGWASGLNLYLATLMLGLAGRAGWADIPEVLTRIDVMIVAGVLFVVEFFADKVPFLDSFWDTIHTFIRPIGAAAIGAVIAGESGSIGAALGGIIAGALALDAHSAKASTRVMVNASPEPVSNAAVSLVEYVGVATLVVIAVAYPIVTIIVVAVLVVAASALTIWLWKGVRRAWGRVRAGFPGGGTANLR
ncbi:MAG: DUF4126 domain-containing protein [Actinomycetota bacterium]